MTARLQRSRARGWRAPEGAVYVGRPSRWGNPWQIVPVHDARFAWGDGADVIGPGGASLGRFDRISRGPGMGAPYWAVRQFEAQLLAGTLPRFTIADVVAELAGKDLLCWCAEGQPCHADVLLRVANQ